MLRIKEKLLQQIFSEAEKAYPNECCGFIFGHIKNDIKTASAIEPNKNSSAECEQFHRFTITAEDMMRAELYARREKLDIIGFYHSHPDCSAEASEYDRSHALAVYSYIIVSCVKGKAAQITNQQLDPGADYTVFVTEEIEKE